MDNSTQIYPLTYTPFYHNPIRHLLIPYLSDKCTTCWILLESTSSGALTPVPHLPALPHLPLSGASLAHGQEQRSAVLVVGYLLVSLSAFLAFLNMNSIESRGQCFNLEPPLKPPQPLHNHITIQCKCHRDECTRIHTAQSRLVGVMIITNHLYVKRFFVGFKVNLIFYQNTHDHVERAQA